MEVWHIIQQTWSKCGPHAALGPFFTLKSQQFKSIKTILYKNVHTSSQ